MENVFQDLEKFSANSTSFSKDLTTRLLEKLEVSVGTIPDDYKDFLLFFGGTIIFNVMLIFKGNHSSPWSDNLGYDALESLYGLNETSQDYSIFEAIETYKNDFKNQFIPIDSSSGGNQILLCIQGNMFGQIWFWDHESDPVFTLDNVISGMTLIADDLQSFLKKLEVDNNEPDISGVISVKLDF